LGDDSIGSFPSLLELARAQCVWSRNPNPRGAKSELLSLVGDEALIRRAHVVLRDAEAALNPKIQELGFQELAP